MKASGNDYMAKFYLMSPAIVSSCITPFLPSSPHNAPRYLYRASTIFGGIYLFFIMERILRSVESWRKRRRDEQRRQRHLSRASQSGDEEAEDGGRLSPDTELPPICSRQAPSIQTNEDISDMRILPAKPRTPKHSESHQALKSPEDQVNTFAFGFSVSTWFERI